MAISNLEYWLSKSKDIAFFKAKEKKESRISYETIALFLALYNLKFIQTNTGKVTLVNISTQPIHAILRRLF